MKDIIAKYETDGYKVVEQSATFVRFSKGDTTTTVYINEEGDIIYVQDNYPVYFARVIK